MFDDFEQGFLIVAFNVSLRGIDYAQPEVAEIYFCYNLFDFKIIHKMTINRCGYSHLMNC